MQDILKSESKDIKSFVNDNSSIHSNIVPIQMENINSFDTLIGFGEKFLAIYSTKENKSGIFRFSKSEESEA